MKFLFRIIAFIAFLFPAQNALLAQTYFQFAINQWQNGNYNLGGNTVTVTNVGTPSGGGSSCGIGGFTFFGNLDNHTKFEFSRPIRKVIINVAGHSNASLLLYTDGIQYPITLGNIATSICTSQTYSLTINSGIITPNTNSSYSINLDAGRSIDSVRFQYLPIPAGDGMSWSFSFTYDSSAYITQPFTPTSLCAGDSLMVPYEVSVPHSAGNSFNVQLSNASGSFASPVSIGTLAATGDGIVRCKIPQTTPAGTGYRIRIVGTAPGHTSNELPVNLTIKASPNTINATANTPLCQGNTLNLNTAVTPAGSYSYSWAGPSYSSGAQNPTITNAATAATGDYIVTATAVSSGCMVKDTVGVLVKSRPAMPAVITTNTPVCSGETLGATINSSTGGSSYEWWGPSGFSATSAAISIPNITLLYSGVYKAVAYNNGCTSDTLNLNVVVNPTPVPPNAGSNSPVCDGGQLMLTATHITGAGSYNWTGPNGYSSHQQNPVIDPVTSADAGTYHVTFTSASSPNCPSAASSVQVLVVPSSYIGSYASPNDTVCAGTTVTFVTVPTATGTNPQYQWYKNGNPISGATSVTYVTTSYATGDTFQCRFKSNDLCSTPITLFGNKIGMQVTGVLTQPSVSISPMAAQPGTPVTFTAIATNGGGQNPQYQWQLNGNNIATGANWSTSNLAPYDKVNCLLTSDDACASPQIVSSDTVEVSWQLAVGGVQLADDGVRLYPNPNYGSFKIKNQKEKIKAIVVLNSIGQVVYEAKGDETQEMDITLRVASGVYLLQVETDAGVERVSFTVR
jgi:hypothetical protein